MVASSLIGSEFNSDRGRKDQAPQLLFMREVEERTPHKTYSWYDVTHWLIGQMSNIPIWIPHDWIRLLAVVEKVTHRIQSHPRTLHHHATNFHTRHQPTIYTFNASQQLITKSSSHTPNCQEHLDPLKWILHHGCQLWSLHFFTY